MAPSLPSALGQSGPQIALHLLDRVLGRGNAGCSAIKRSLFKLPLFAAAIDKFHVVVTIELENPGASSGKPVPFRA